MSDGIDYWTNTATNGPLYVKMSLRDMELINALTPYTGLYVEPLIGKP